MDWLSKAKIAHTQEKKNFTKQISCRTRRALREEKPAQRELREQLYTRWEKTSQTTSTHKESFTPR